MPCNGITVLRPVPLKDEAWEEIKNNESARAATAKWLTNMGFQVLAIRPQGADVAYVTASGSIIVGPTGVRGSGTALPQNLTADLAKFTESLAGYLAQSKIAQAVAQRAQVLSQQRAPNGVLVMEVKF